MSRPAGALVLALALLPAGGFAQTAQSSPAPGPAASPAGSPAPPHATPGPKASRAPHAGRTPHPGASGGHARQTAHHGQGRPSGSGGGVTPNVYLDAAGVKAVLKSAKPGPTKRPNVYTHPEPETFHSYSTDH